MDVLRYGVVGEFFVRDVHSHPGSLGLSIKVGYVVWHAMHHDRPTPTRHAWFAHTNTPTR